MAPTDASGVVVLNPAAGSGDHAATVADLAANAGFAVRETAAAGDGVELAREAAAEGASTVAAAGGDGTLNEVVRGVRQAGALDRVTVGVVPAGTGNDFAENVGVTDIEGAFDVLLEGDRRALDLATADDVPFVNSCVGGLTANASAETTPELKRRLGIAAYLVTTLRELATFDGMRLSVEVRGDGTRRPAWSGEALCVLVGNGRRFTTQGIAQADVEDGRLDVTIVEDVSTVDLMGDALDERLFGEDAEHTTRLQASALDVTVLDGTPVTFSLDGEMIESCELSFGVRPGALRMAVGEGYDPDPDP